MVKKIVKSEQEWMQELTPEQFQICRLKGTEQAGTGKYNGEKRTGTYNCVCCGQPLFSSEAKFESGTGWPSFFAQAEENGIDTEIDTSRGMERTEIMCSHCGSHLGHVFPDGPKPTGLRYCVNSLSLKFEPEDDGRE